MVHQWAADFFKCLEKTFFFSVFSLGGAIILKYLPIFYTCGYWVLCLVNVVWVCDCHSNSSRLLISAYLFKLPHNFKVIRTPKMFAVKIIFPLFTYFVNMLSVIYKWLWDIFFSCMSFLHFCPQPWHHWAGTWRRFSFFWTSLPSSCTSSLMLTPSNLPSLVKRSYTWLEWT